MLCQRTLKSNFLQIYNLRITNDVNVTKNIKNELFLLNEHLDDPRSGHMLAVSVLTSRSLKGTNKTICARKSPSLEIF